MVHSADYIRDYSLRDSTAGEVTPHFVHSGYGNSFIMPRYQEEYMSFYNPRGNQYYSGYRNRQSQGFENYHYRNPERYYNNL